MRNIAERPIILLLQNILTLKLSTMGVVKFSVIKEQLEEQRAKLRCVKKGCRIEDIY